MHIPFKLYTALVASALAVPAAHAAPRPGDPKLDGQQIEARQDRMQTGYGGETRDMTLTLISAQNTKSVRKLSFAGIESKEGKEKTLVTFTYPPDMKGSSLLTHEHGQDDDDQWLYLPEIKRIKRIASANQSGSFMGSEFAYEDLVVRQLAKYTFKYLGDEVIDGQDCYVIERIPRNTSSGYSRAVRWRIKSNLQELRTEYYDRKGALLKVRRMEGHHLLDGFWRVTRISVENVQTNRKSILDFDNVKLRVALTEQQFSVQEFNAAQ